jgi:hypothetical protein
MSADVESFTTYYAICAKCGWEGEEHDDDKPRAEKEADAHKCPGESREEFQAALDHAMEPLTG